MGDRRRGADHRYRERSPMASRHRDRSSERRRDRSADRYRSSRHQDRSRSRSSSYSRDRRAAGHQSSSRNLSQRRSTSRGRFRSSRSRSPRNFQQSSRYSASNRHHQRSRSNSNSSPTSYTPRSKRERSSPTDERVAPPPPSFPRKTDSYDESDTDDNSLSATCSNKKFLSRTIPTPSGSSGNSHPLYGQDNSNSESSTQFETDMSEPIDKERIHREMEEKLRLALAKEGKIYPPPKPEANHPVFANDGSFLEIFKKMQEQMAQQQANADAAELRAKNQPACKRRGGKILKTGIVAKSRATDTNSDDPKDFWSIYLQEVKKYKNTSCDVDSQTRPLVK